MCSAGGGPHVYERAEDAGQPRAIWDTQALTREWWTIFKVRDEQLALDDIARLKLWQ